MNQAICAVLIGPASEMRLTEPGMDTVGNLPAQAAKPVADKMVRWTAVIKAAGVKAE